MPQQKPLRSGGGLQALGLVNRIVCKTGPLLALGLERLDVLKTHFAGVLITEAVHWKGASSKQ